MVFSLGVDIFLGPPDGFSGFFLRLGSSSTSMASILSFWLFKLDGQGSECNISF
uniref:Uncharacterized protein n=1 Tax=Arundo donax TaxID=35708 RepID=A0A0A9H6X6_ARUDO